MIRIDYEKIRQLKRYDGKRVLYINDDTISLEDAACGHKGLMVIEHCLGSMKRTQIKVCPMFHWVVLRIETKVKICMPSLFI
jgi:hypothetical protein